MRNESFAFEHGIIVQEFVNPGGYHFELVTVTKADVLLTGQRVSSDTFFLGFDWTIAVCDILYVRNAKITLVGGLRRLMLLWELNQHFMLSFMRSFFTKWTDIRTCENPGTPEDSDEQTYFFCILNRTTMMMSCSVGDSLLPKNPPKWRRGR